MANLYMRRSMMGENVIDTSPKIVQYNYRFPNGKGNPYTADGYCITEKYWYEPSEETQTLVTYAVARIRTYIDDVYKDYWVWNGNDGYSRKVVNIGTNMMELELVMSRIDSSYAYLAQTGQILFAGKNSRYYGYRNINDMPNQGG